MWNATPASRRRLSQARNIGAAFLSTGNTRPDVPMKVSTPNAATQARNASAPNAASNGAIASTRSP